MSRPIRTVVLAALALVASAGAAAARTTALTVALDGNRRIELGGEAATVVVGDPSVADVAMTNAHSLVLLGRGYGSTQIVVTDRKGRTLLASQVTVVEPDDGHVTVFRGLAPSEFTCVGGRCEPAAPAPASSGGADPSAPAPAGVPSYAPPSYSASSAMRSGGEAAAAAMASRSQP